MGEGSKDYEVGKGKPPKHTRFGQPDGPAPGKTKTQKRLEMANAEKAMKIREMLLDAVGAQLQGMEQSGRLAFVEAAMLKLLKDSEDRGLGAPIQDIRSGDGSMTPKDHSSAVLDAIKAKHATKPE